GGKTGFGEVTREVNEPVFHQPWEGLAWALNVLSIAKLRAYKSDTYRHAVERMKPSWYNDARYYERMLAGVTTLLVEQGVVSLEDLFPWFVFHSETPEARFSPGDTVRVIAKATRGHTRCPAYIRGKEGVQL